MGLFGTKRKKGGIYYGEVDASKLQTPPPYLNGYQPTLDDASEEMKNTAIEYIVSLNKADKDKFFAGAELIWQGYQDVDNVKTKHQKALQRNAKASDGDQADSDDELLGSFLDDDEVTPRAGGK